MRPVELSHTPAEPVNERTLIFVAHGRVARPDPPQAGSAQVRPVMQRQVGWLGHDGNVYAMNEEQLARDTVLGGVARGNVPYSPLYIDVDAD